MNAGGQHQEASLVGGGGWKGVWGEEGRLLRAWLAAEDGSGGGVWWWELSGVSVITVAGLSG